MPYREAGDPVNGRSQNIALVTNTRSFVQAVLYLELKPARGRIGGRPMERGPIPHEGEALAGQSLTKNCRGVIIPWYFENAI